MFCTALLISWLMSGVTLGHIALREILLRREGLLCTSQDEFQLGNACYEREVLLNGIFFISSSITKLCALPVGLAIDVWGPRLTTMLGCVIFAVGCVLLALSNFSLGPLHYVGYVVLSVGGTCVYFPSLAMGRILPRMEGLASAALTVAFDVSAIVFYLLGWIVTPTRSLGSVMACYLIVPVLAFVLVTSFYPSGLIPALWRRRREPKAIRGGGKPERHRFAPLLRRTDSLAGFNSNVHTMMSYSEQDHLAAGGRRSALALWGRLLASWEFWLVAVFVGTISGRFVQFLSTLTLRLARLALPWEEQRALLDGYQTFLPLGGLIIMTAAGQLLLSYSLATNTAIVWVLVNLCWAPLVSGREGSYQAAAYLLAALIRPYFYAVANHMAERLFGPADLGRGYGLLMAIAGLFSLGAIVSVYDGFPIRTWWLVQTWHLLRLLTLASVALPVYLYLRRL